MEHSRRTVRVAWRSPLLAAHGAPDAAIGRELTVVELRDEQGHRGHGESAPLPGYLGGSTALADQAALDVAAWDLRARAANEPLWAMLGAAAAPPLAVNATIGAEEPGVAAEEAVAAARGGFGVVKVKVGIGDDLERLAAIRDAVGGAVGIRIDANGAWKVEQAATELRRLAPVGIELCEEPVHGADALAAVAARCVEVPVFADESAAEVLERGTGDCTGVCLKVARGGITALLADAARARERGYEVYLASTLDGPLGIAAALHAAAVIAPDRPCGLATLDRFDRPSPIPVRDGHMSAPAGLGLGDGLLGWYEG